MKTKLSSAIVFVETVNRGSISKGAVACHMTRSAASKNIQSLEHALEVQLLNRSTRRLSLTDAGRVYYEKLKNALEELEAVELEVASFRAEPSGVLKISSSVLFGRLYLTEIVENFLKKYPRVVVDMSLSDELSETISEGVDIFFRTGVVRHQDMIAKKLSDVVFRTVAAPSYFETREKPKSIKELGTHNCLNYKFPTDKTTFEWRFRTGNETAFHRFTGNFVTDDVGELHRLALRGNGIAQLPGEMVTGDIKAKRLIELFPESVFPSNELFMCYQQKKKSDPKVQKFRDYLLNWMPAK